MNRQSLARLDRIERALEEQTPQLGDCHAGTDVLILTGDLLDDKILCNRKHTRIFLDAEWRAQAVGVIVAALADGEWHQTHFDNWQGEPGAREMWAMLQEHMTWAEKCDLLAWLKALELIEGRYIKDGDIFPEYRLLNRADPVPMLTSAEGLETLADVLHVSHHFARA